MLSDLITSHPYLTLFTAAFFVNIPLGILREQTLKFTFKWLLWIHASIPLIVYMRLELGTSTWGIPLSIFFAIVGQQLGAKWQNKRTTQAQREALRQIPDLNLKRTETVPQEEVLVALLNMGGPRTNDDVKDFQQHLFVDPLLIRFPLSFLLQKFFAWMLITFRLKAVKERYQLIGGGSPIYRSTTQQAKALREELSRRNRNIDVTFSFNYSPPFPEDTIEKAKHSQKKYLLPLSLYPHYSKATTGSNMHYLKKAVEKNYPGLEMLACAPYYLHDGYIQAFVDRIQETIQVGESLDDFYLVFSAHGLPEYFLNEGDPYPFQISQTVAKILAQLGRKTDWIVSYQSAVGPLQWLKPSTDDILEALAKRGVQNVIMVPVSFVGDHIETTCEIDIEYRELAEKMGYQDYRMAQAIESHPGFISALADTVELSLGLTTAGPEMTQQYEVPESAGVI